MYSFESDSQEMLDAIYDWRTNTNNKSFDTSFVDSLQENLNKYHSLTDNQQRALVNICNKFKIGEE